MVSRNQVDADGSALDILSDLLGWLTDDPFEASDSARHFRPIKETINWQIQPFTSAEVPITASIQFSMLTVLGTPQTIETVDLGFEIPDNTPFTDVDVEQNLDFFAP